MEAVLKSIKDWFLGKRDYFNAFAKADSRLEGWLKVELILLLPNLVKTGLLENFERECRVTTPAGRKQVDFSLTARGELHYCELKAMCISQAAGTPRDLKFYFRDDQVGLIKDFKKLDIIPSDNKWVLGLVYPNPGLSQWADAVESLPDSLKHWQCRTRPDSFPEYLFVSVWKPKPTSNY